MSLILKPTETCNHKASCPYADNCQGTKTRNVTFVCDYVKDDGTIRERKYRNPNDQTGKMKVLLG